MRNRLVLAAVLSVLTAAPAFAAPPSAAYERLMSQASEAKAGKRWRAMEARAAEASRLEPQHPDAWSLRGQALIELERPAEAAAALQAAVERDPTLWMAWHDLALARRSAGDFQGALAALRREAELRPRDADIPYSMGLVRLDLNDAAGAEADFRRALAMNPGNAQASLQLAISLALQDRGAEALGLVQEAIDASPKSVEANAALVAIKLRMGDRAGAENALARLRVLDRRQAHQLSRRLGL